MSVTYSVTSAAWWPRAAFRAWPALLPALLFLPMVLVPPVNHDVAAVLSFSERWLAGERLYLELIDVNPPLIFVLNLLPAAIARVTGLGSIVALLACLVVLGFALWWLTLAVRDRGGEGPIERVLLDVLPGLLIFGAGYEFGQRETLMVAMALPYLLAAARRMQGQAPRLMLLAGLVAAVGFALKPHFLVVPTLVEAAVLLVRVRHGAGRQALRDPVPWAMAALWLGYLVSLPLVFPAYLGTVVPLVLEYYLDNGGQTAWGLLLQPRLSTVVVFMVPLTVMAWRQRASLPRVLALAGLGALFSALFQHKGWSYHIMPIELFAGALAGVQAACWLDAQRAGEVSREGAVQVSAVHVAAGLAGLFAIYLLARGDAPWNALRWRQSDAYALAQILRAEAAGGRVLALSPGIAPIYPALNYAGARMTLRTMNIWLLEGVYRDCPESNLRYRAVGEMGQPELFLYRTVAEDFARAPPTAVVVDSMTAIPACGGQAFNLIEYFNRNPVFAAVWSQYAEVGRQRRYTVYVRRDR